MEDQRALLLETLDRTLHEHLGYGNQRWKSVADIIGLTVVQASVLIAISSNSACCMHDLIDLTHQSGAALTGVIDRLLKLDLVVRQPDQQDRRVVNVALTAKGLERLHLLATCRKSMLVEDLQMFTDEELQQLTGLIQKFSTGMQHAIRAADPADLPGSPCSHIIEDGQQGH